MNGEELTPAAPPGRFLATEPKRSYQFHFLSAEGKSSDNSFLDEQSRNKGVLRDLLRYERQIINQIATKKKATRKP